MFIRINSDVIVNSNNICSIERKAITSEEYDAWQNNYNVTMNNVVQQYLIQHPEELETTPEDKLVDILINRFSKYVEDSLGKCPDAFVYTYYITLDNHDVYEIDEHMYYSLNKILDVVYSDYDFNFLEKHDI